MNFKSTFSIFIKMEEVNPWLDPQMGSHNNKKSIKPEVVKNESKVESKIETEQDTNLEDPQSKKDKIDQFLDTLVKDGLDSNLPPNSCKWAEEHFGKEWLEEFKQDLETLTDELLTSHYFPSEPTMILLKLVFLLRQ